MKKILVNLKDWLNYAENVDFAERIDGLDITVFPSLPYLYIYKGRNIKIGSQKISSFDEGPHTGSISASHLKDFGVEAVILNHRECQIDDIDKICAKVKNAQNANMETIICIGSIAKEELAKIKSVLEKTGTKDILVAYEPNDDIQLDEIKLNLELIKSELYNFDIPYIYGNNVTIHNIEEYDRELDVQGFLISSHALDVDNLRRMVTLVKS